MSDLSKEKTTLMSDLREEKATLGLRGNLSILLPTLWLLTGAAFKLFAGGPLTLPDLILDFAREHEVLDLVFYGAIGIELSIVALALLLPAIGWKLLSLQYCIFVALLVKLYLDGAESCGCMGPSFPITPLTMIAIDGALLALLITAKPWRLKLPVRGPRWLTPTLVIGCLVFPWYHDSAGIFSDAAPSPKEADSGAKAQEAGSGPQASEEDSAGDKDQPAAVKKPRYVDLQLGKWVDQDIFSTPLAPWVDFESGELPLDGLYVFYRQTCEHCADHLMELFEQDVGLPIVLVKINEKSDDEENNLILVKPEGPHIKEIELDSEIQWVVETPADLELAGGVVVRGEEGIGKD